MGNAHSPPTDPRFMPAARAFTQKELDDLESLFESLAAQSNSNGLYISPNVFQIYLGLKGPLAERLFNLVTQHRKDHQLTYEDLVIAKGTYEKGAKDEIEEFIYQLLDVNGDHKVGRNWCLLIPSARKFLGSLLMPPDPGRAGRQVPHLVHMENIDSKMLLLRREYAWHIGGALSQQELEEWRLLYHSAFNGLSFNTFLGCISNGEGPKVLIIKDREGYIYGGYASQPWERHGDFYGNMKSFLFQLYPKASIFKPTGASANIQWCAVNFNSESIPNGIGFGGSVNHFGLFISAGFDHGHTYACTTFGNPCLSKANQIYPEVIECWVVIRNVKQERRDAAIGTVLDRFKEDRHMLNMVGLANSTE